eukprot:c17198_g1_i1.p1 GENE.c17198_g1_i1~~c17198_g1_i1.p1  ORF type:complete len:215 (-),score=48.09 c17198_g1_i1:96-740(-)
MTEQQVINHGIDVKEGDDMTLTTTRNSKHITKQELSNELGKFVGKKERRASSEQKIFCGDYLGLSTSKVVNERISKSGDKQILFADYAIKVNRKNKMQKRLIIITDNALYNMDPTNYKVKRRIPIVDIGSISMSNLPDNFFAIHVPSEYDYLMVSVRKTEIVTLLMREYENLKKSPLSISFNDGFEYKIANNHYRHIQFSKVEGGVNTQIYDKK